MWGSIRTLNSLYTRECVCNETWAQDLLREAPPLNRRWQVASQSGSTSVHSCLLHNDSTQCPSTFCLKSPSQQLNRRERLSCFGTHSVCGSFVLTGVFLSLGPVKYSEIDSWVSLHRRLVLMMQGAGSQSHRCLCSWSATSLWKSNGLFFVLS